MKKRQELLTDELWQLIEPLLPKPGRIKDKRWPFASAEPSLLRRRAAGFAGSMFPFRGAF
jgi:transposase